MTALRVITATRGRSPHLAETIASVQALGIPVRQVLVSPAEAVADLRGKFPHCEVVSEPAAGLYSALNAGLALPGDETEVTWLNDDDLLVRDGFLRAHRQLVREARLGAVYGRVSLIDGAGRRLAAIPVATRPGDLGALLGAGLMPLAQPGLIVKRAVLVATGGFDATYRLAGDLDLVVRLLRAEVRFGFIDGEVAQFRVHGGQLSKQEALAAEEHTRAIAPLPRVAARVAEWRFRLANLAGYIERVRRHGWKSMQELYRHE